MCDTLTGEKAQFVRTHERHVIGGARWRAMSGVRACACLRVYVRACMRARYEIRTGGQDDGRQEASGNREWWLARHKLTGSHSPTHFQAREHERSSLSSAGRASLLSPSPPSPSSFPHPPAVVPCTTDPHARIEIRTLFFLRINPRRAFNPSVCIYTFGRLGGSADVPEISRTFCHVE